MDALVLCALSDRARLPCLHAETYAITNHKRCPFLGIRLFDNTTLTLFRSPTQTRHAVDSRRDTPASGKPRDDGTACFQPVARRKRHSRRGEWASECHRLEGLEGLTCLVEYCQLEATNLEGTLIYFEWRLHFKLDFATDSLSIGGKLASFRGDGAVASVALAIMRAPNERMDGRTDAAEARCRRASMRLRHLKRRALFP